MRDKSNKLFHLQGKNKITFVRLQSLKNDMLYVTVAPIFGVKNTVFPVVTPFTLAFDF